MGSRATISWSTDSTASVDPSSTFTRHRSIYVNFCLHDFHTQSIDRFGEECKEGFHSCKCSASSHFPALSAIDIQDPKTEDSTSESILRLLALVMPASRMGRSKCRDRQDTPQSSNPTYILPPFRLRLSNLRKP